MDNMGLIGFAIQRIKSPTSKRWGYRLWVLRDTDEYDVFPARVLLMKRVWAEDEEDNKNLSWKEDVEQYSRLTGATKEVAFGRSYILYYRPFTLKEGDSLIVRDCDEESYLLLVVSKDKTGTEHSRQIIWKS